MNRRIGIFTIALGLLATSLSAAEKTAPRGGRVGWARLITSDSNWGIHSDQDPKLASFIRGETSLNIDPTWYSVYAAELEKLCAYPFLYVKDLTRLTDQLDRTNLQEYIKRGGFICIDPCTTHFSAYDLESFIKRHATYFAKLLPGATVRELPDNHEIFHCYFTVKVDDLFTPDVVRAGGAKPARIGMQGVFVGERMIGVISVSGLECGWPQTPGRQPGCMKMIVNSYVYAMTRS